jgi:hypothetical protein
MINFSITINNADQLMAALHRHPIVATREIESGLDRAGNEILKNVKIEEPVDTGNLRNTTHIEKGKLSRVIKTDCNYAAAIQEGSSAVSKNTVIAIDSARISPRSRASLPLPNKNGIIFFRGRKAIPANPFMDRAIDKSGVKVQQIFVNVLDNIAKNSFLI